MATQAQLSLINSTSLNLNGKIKTESKKQKARALADTVAVADVAKEESSLSLQVPVLPVAKPTNGQSKNYLKDMEEAIASIFNQMGRGVEQGINAQLPIQQLSMAASEQLVTTTKSQVKQIENEVNIIKKEESVQDADDTITDVISDISTLGVAAILRHFNVSEQTIGYVSTGMMFGMAALGMGLGAVVSVWGAVALDATMAAAETGATAIGEGVSSAVSAVRSAVTGAAEGAEDLEDVDAISSDDETSSSDVESSDEEYSGVMSKSSDDESINSDDSDTDDEEGIEETESKNAYKKAMTKLLDGSKTTGRFAGKTTVSILKYLGRASFQIAPTAVFASPSLVQCITGTEISGYKKQLATAQRGIGTAAALIGETSAISRFYQQFLQRGADMLSGLTGQLQDTLNTFSAANKSYLTIVQGLSRAV